MVHACLAGSLVLVFILLALTQPLDRPTAHWNKDGMTAPQDQPIVGVWFDRSGEALAVATVRIRGDFYEYTQKDRAVFQFNGPPQFWLPLPRRMP